MKSKEPRAGGRKGPPEKSPRPGKVQRTTDVRVPKLSHLVAERLRQQIAAGQLNSGDTLPQEADLLRLFQVSRPIMREALRVLEAESLIRLGRGARAGATILGPSIDTAAKYGALYLATQGTTLGMIHEVRSLLEPPLAALLAQRPAKGFLKELEECTLMQREAISNQDHAAAILAVNEFHHRMFGLSHNSALNLLAGMLHNISAAIYPHLLLSLPNQKAVRTQTEKSSRAQAELLTLISASKADLAEAHWRDYMADMAAFLSEWRLANKRVRFDVASM